VPTPARAEGRAHLDVDVVEAEAWQAVVRGRRRRAVLAAPRARGSQRLAPYEPNVTARTDLALPGRGGAVAHLPAYISSSSGATCPRPRRSSFPHTHPPVRVIGRSTSTKHRGGGGGWMRPRADGGVVDEVEVGLWGPAASSIQSRLRERGAEYVREENARRCRAAVRSRALGRPGTRSRAATPRRPAGPAPRTGRRRGARHVFCMLVL
jgi:hypothetical protein